VVGVVKSFMKTAVERRRLYADYNCFLADTEKLTDFQVLIAPTTEDAPLGVVMGYPDATQRKLMFYVNGGRGNTSYVLSLIVHTNEGQTKRDDIGVRVYP